MTVQSLSTKLFNSRLFDHETGRRIYQSEMVDLVQQLEAAAAAKGLTLSRWETTVGKYGKSITYALHSGERAAQFRYQPKESVVDYCYLGTLEGTSRRCEAYRALSAMLDQIV